jgi:Chaperone of endosialidase
VIPWGIAAGAIGAIGSAVIGSNAASDASNEQLQAAQLASQTQLQMYNQTRSDLSPYLSTGTSALSQLSSLFGLGGTNGTAGTGPTNATAQNTLSALQNYPGYQFQYNQGLQALDRSAASRGLLLSGAQVKDAQTYGQGVAQSSALQPYLSTLTGLASQGENAGALTGNAATATGQGVASSELAGGQAQAAGTIGSANALTTGLQGGLNNALLGYSLYNSPSSSGTSGLDTSALDATLNAPLTLSDSRTKTDISRVGKTESGLPIYTFRYKSGGPKQMGVMAQEVEKVRPDAVTTLSSGLKMVDYGKLSALSHYDRKAA